MPQSMRAALLESINASPKISSVPQPEVKIGEVLVELKSAALNRRDLWIQQGAYPHIELPAILGSDASGALLGTEKKEVLICPSLNWGENEAHQGRTFSILGMPSQGTLAEKISVPAENIVSKPIHLQHQEAAALPLAGLTAWRSLFTKGALCAGERVLITGVGGGVALFALQFALAAGAEVFVTSSSAEKIQRAKNMGAQDGVCYTNPSWRKRLPDSFDVIIDSAGGSDFGELIKLLGMGGRLCFFGGTRGAWPSILPQRLFFKQASILASTMGSPAEFKEMCEFVGRHKIVPVVDSVFPLHEITSALERLVHPDRFGKVVVSIA